MEDISRELEREIARAKPKPHKTSRRKKILVVDDFGEMRPGNYLKTLLYLFACFGMAGFIGVAGLYVVFNQAVQENRELKARLEALEKKSARLTNDKELLMARLVMSGEKPELPQPVATKTPSLSAQSKAKKKKVKPKPEPEPQPVKENVPHPDPSPPAPSPEPEPVQPASADSKTEVSPPASESGGMTGEAVSDPLVAVEDFTVSKGAVSGELVVRFDIRNVSSRPGGVSGRIFTVLKPKDTDARAWVVVPSAPMDNGVPAAYEKGQYFSISRFKPVKFTVRNQNDPDYFRVATVYIFNDVGKLMFKSDMSINEVKTE